MLLYYKKPEHWAGLYGALYFCDHPCYNRCTAFVMKEKGVAIIQQRYEPGTKKTWWDAIDPWLADDIYLNPGFLEFFNKNAEEKKMDDTYPTFTVRQVMRTLGMRPLEKQKWETRF